MRRPTHRRQWTRKRPSSRSRSPFVVSNCTRRRLAASMVGPLAGKPAAWDFLDEVIGVPGSLGEGVNGPLQDLALALRSGHEWGS
jgi:hypothetical protein